MKKDLLKITEEYHTAYNSGKIDKDQWIIIENFVESVMWESIKRKLNKKGVY